MSLQQDELLIIYWWLLIHSDEYCLRLSINTVIRHSSESWVLVWMQSRQNYSITQKLMTSAQDGKTSNSEKPLLFSVDLFHPSNWFSRYIKSIFYFFNGDFYCDMKKKNVKISYFPSLLLKSFQSRIDWQLFLRQLHDKWIFLPEYLQYWAESYSRRKQLWLRLSRKSFMFFLQRGCLPWCQRQTSLRTPALEQV